MQEDLRERFRKAFFESLRVDERAPLLKQAALTQRLGPWTRETLGGHGPYLPAIGLAGIREVASIGATASTTK